MTSDWIAIEAADLKSYLAAPQIEALRKIALAKDQEDPLLDIIQHVIARIRAEIRSYGKHYIDKREDRIPHFLKISACYLIIEALQTRIPMLRLTQDQIRNADNARLFLRRIGQGEVLIRPESQGEEGSVACEVLARRESKLSGTALRGL